MCSPTHISWNERLVSAQTLSKRWYIDMNQLKTHHVQLNTLSKPQVAVWHPTQPNPTWPDLTWPDSSSPIHPWLSCARARGQRRLSQLTPSALEPRERELLGRGSAVSESIMYCSARVGSGPTDASHDKKNKKNSNTFAGRFGLVSFTLMLPYPSTLRKAGPTTYAYPILSYYSKKKHHGAIRNATGAWAI